MRDSQWTDRSARLCYNGCRSVARVDSSTDIRCLLLTLPLGENLHRIQMRQGARALDEREFEQRTVVEERDAPDKPKAFAEARRVLKPGGVLIFSVWDRVEENDFANTVTTAIGALFPGDTPSFLAQTPHGYYDRQAIERDLAGGGFTAPCQFTTVPARSRASSPRIAAVALCQGTPLCNEIESRDATRLGEATDIATEAIARRFGRGPVDGKMQAHIVTIEN